MSVIITGATGFVGSNLYPYLSKDFIVKNLSKVELNAVSVDDFKEVFAVVHLARKAHDLKKTSSDDEYYHINLELTKKLYDVFLESATSTFIFVSSVKAAADIVVNELTEDSYPQPKTHYNKSKLMAEDYIRAQPLPQGKSFYILRPCMIGPGNKGNLNLLYQFVYKGIPYPLAACSNKRSFLSVANLCFVVKLLLQRNNVPSGIYNVADDDALSTTEVVKILAASSNVKPRLWPLSPCFIRRVARLRDLLHLPLDTERLAKLTENYIVNNKKIKQALITQLPLTAAQGLELTANLFIKN